MTLRSLFVSCVLAATLLIRSGAAWAGLSPVGLSLIPPLQFPGSEFTIVGARASVFWGDHRKVYGFDVGAIGNITEGDFGGVAVSGVFNTTRGTTTVLGLQAAGGANINSGKLHVLGVQVAGLFNSNSAEASIIGVNVAGVNLSPHAVIGGFQVGVYNRAHEVFGFQIGVVNETDLLHGFQIGVVNINHQGLFAVSPALNVGF
jgi:hypothetical protein